MSFDFSEENKETLALFPELAQLLSDLPNYQVVNDTLLRGGQPTRGGFTRLKGEGVKTVVNLREDTGQILEEEKLVQILGLNYESIPLNPFFRPGQESVLRFLEIVLEPEMQPVFVHCLHGQDRTGMMVGIYRMVVDGFDFKTSFNEMLALGFHQEFTYLMETARSYEGKNHRDLLQK